MKFTSPFSLKKRAERAEKHAEKLYRKQRQQETLEYAKESAKNAAVASMTQVGMPLEQAEHFAEEYIEAQFKKTAKENRRIAVRNFLGIKPKETKETPND